VVVDSFRHVYRRVESRRAGNEESLAILSRLTSELDKMAHEHIQRSQGDYNITPTSPRIVFLASRLKAKLVAKKVISLASQGIFDPKEIERLVIADTKRP
jgi:hypothetical protein